MSEKNGVLDPVNPGEVRYIKLGPGGAWENASLDKWPRAKVIHRSFVPSVWKSLSSRTNPVAVAGAIPRST